MVKVREVVKTNLVTSKERVEDLFPLRKFPEDF
jgi:hypothetical protein